MMRRNRLVLGDEAEDAQAWPIPLWRPKRPPSVSLRKKVLNLISPTPSLENAVPIPRVPLQPHAVNQPQFPMPPARTASGRRRWSTQPRPVGGLDVLVEDSEYSPRNSQSRLSIISRSASVMLTPETFKNPEAQIRRRSMPGPSSLLTAPSSRSPRSAVVQIPAQPAATPGTPGTPPRPPSPNPLTQAKTQILHLYRVLHCLDLARQLLHTYNLLANTALSSAPFPPSVLREWETDMDEWWSESSGVLNAAHQRVKVIVTNKEAEWQDLVKKNGKDLRKEKRGLVTAWKSETKPRWDNAPQVRRGSADSGQSSLSRVPGWVVDIVTEPFGPDEIEEEVWRLEAEGTVPSGTFLRMFGRRDGHSRPNIPHGEFGDLTPQEVDQAARLGLREIDLDEKHRKDREAWREGRYAKRRSMFQ